MSPPKRPHQISLVTRWYSVCKLQKHCSDSERRTWPCGAWASSCTTCWWGTFPSCLTRTSSRRSSAGLRACPRVPGSWCLAAWGRRSWRGSHCSRWGTTPGWRRLILRLRLQLRSWGGTRNSLIWSCLHTEDTGTPLWYHHLYYYIC